jgi:hypothetical protein
MHNKTLGTLLLALGLLGLAGRASGQLQWTAYNDHYAGPGTHANATAWNVFGTAGGAPGAAGPLKNIASGADLPVTLTITNTGAVGGTTSGSPGAGTPAYNTFNGFIDFGSGTLNHAVQLPPPAVAGYTFTGLSSTKRYRFTGTAVRGGGYLNRWTTYELVSAAAFTRAHTAGCLTNGTPGVPAGDITLSQAVLNSGENSATGDTVVWNDIDPGPDGSFTVTALTYRGTVPGGASDGSYGYAFMAIKLEEFDFVQTPVAITNQPQDRIVNELAPASFTVGVSGNPAPTFQWYRNGALLADATNATYMIAAALLSDHNAQFQVVVANTVSNVNYAVTSSVATLTVIADTNPPVLVRALSVPPSSVSVDFSEPIRLDTATDVANYAITSSLGTLTISAAVLSPSQTNVVLTTAPQTLGTMYTLTVNGIRDQSAAGNLIASNSQTTFVTLSYTLANIGTPSVNGSATPGGNGYDVTASGGDIGGSSDVLALNYQLRSGNFDVKARVAAFTLSDPWAEAGLMAREFLSSTSRFAASLTTPAMAGCYFQSRATAGQAASTSGSFPNNFPYTWLRLQRVGDAFTGYASADGENWARLGSATLSGAGTMYVGMAVSSRTNGVPATAQFRDVMDAVGGTFDPQPLPFEPPGPSRRTTGLALTEIMYNPGSPIADDVACTTNGAVVECTIVSHSLEFVELYNSNPFFEDISGYRIAGSVDYTFPSNTIIAGGAYLVIARDPAAVQVRYGIAGVHGPWQGYGTNRVCVTNVTGGVTNVACTNFVGNTNSLPSDAGTVRLRNKEDAIYLEVNYTDSNPWPHAADGLGHSLVLRRPSYGENDPQAWAASDLVGGSPGRADGYSGGALRNVVINEILAHTDLPLLDYLELYNHANTAVDISGCILTDDPDTNVFVVPNGTVIPPRGFVYFEEDDLGFQLSSSGETVYFKSPDGLRMLDAVQFEAQANGVAFGRWPNGAKEFHPLVARTPGTNNSAILIRDVVINEIMYKPVSGNSDDEYVELCNKGTNAANLTGWRFTAGITYNFPSNTIIAPGGYLVVARSKTNLLAKYPQLNGTNTVGDYNGSLANRGERLALAMPDQVVRTNGQGQIVTNTIYVVADEVSYVNGGQWGNWSNEGGSSLELIDPRSNRRLAFNWADSDDTTKSSNLWTTIESTSPMDNGGGTASHFEILAFGEGEYLVDEVAVIDGAGTNILTGANANFEGGQGSWAHRGTHIRSTWENGTGFGGGGCLHIRASARGDTIANRSLVALPRTPTGTVTLRARVRWLRGWPELLLRLHGNYCEAYGRLQVPPNLGTPGLRNTAAVSNAPPAIYEVNHFPVVPAASQAAVVTARVHDPDGVASVILRYRADPSATYTAVTMTDNGSGGDAVAGDGLYSGTIPGQTANTLVAFYVQATDAAVPAQSVTFPRNASPMSLECLVRFGDPVVTASFASYRIWMTAANVNTWQSRPALSNERLPGTFVYSDVRAVHFMGVKWSGSPYHQFGGNANADGHYSIDLPLDTLVLGTENFNKLHMPGNGPGDDNTIQREQTAYWFARQLGLPWNYRRCAIMFFNGNRRGGTTSMIEDTETPGNDVVESRFPDDPEGDLYKLQPWFEVDDGTGRSLGFVNQSWCLMNKFTTVSNSVTIHDTARYRHNYLVRAADGTANHYAPVFALIDAADTSTNGGWAAHTAALEALVDVEEWTRIWSVCHAVGDWDHFGTQNSQNMYGYKPRNGKWQLMIWDLNIVLGNSGSWTPGQNLVGTYTGAEARMQRIYANPTFRRMYFRALKELATGPMVASQVGAVMNAKYNAYVASGVTPTSPSAAVAGWIEQARTAILSTVATEDAASFALNGPTSITTNNNLITLSGNAPVEIKNFKVNGMDYPVTWTSVRAWILRIPVNAASSTLNIAGYDLRGNPVPGASVTVNVNYTGSFTDPQGAVVFNEIMYNPVVPEASFVEIFNTATGFSFDISGWRINGLDYTFPPGSILSNRQYLLLAKDRTAFSSAFGSSNYVFGEFNGTLDLDGETLTLFKPGAAPGQEDVVDKVKYEARLPWPVSANGTGPSLQLIDVAQDNARVSNWSDGAGWRFASFTANLGTLASSSVRLFLTAAGDIYVDDVFVAVGSVPEVGTNLLRNGDFEGPLTTNQGGPWSFFGTTATNTAITTSVKHNGNASLHLIQTGAGTSGYLVQTGVPLVTNTTYTVSFWYLPTTNGTAFNIYLNSSFRPAFNVLPLLSTPGGANTVAAFLPPYDPVWLNELQPENLTGIRDGQNEREPWIEIYNGGTNTVDLSGYYLANNYAGNLTQWQFPAGTTIGPGAFRLVFADGEHATETVGTTELHTSFRLPPGAGTVALVRLVSNQPQITDYLTYTNIGPDLSYGDYPDGQPFDRQVFFDVTPGTNNSARPVPLFLNEWMASNTGFLFDPADTDTDDWFELYNPNNVAVDLSGYYFTDVLTDKTKYRIPNGTVIPAGSFMFFWADNETGQNGPGRDLHVGFRLNATRSDLALYSPNGVLVDGLTFSNQTANVSMGRYADGAASLYLMTTPTPGAPNQLPAQNTAPTISPIADRTVTLGQTLTLTVTANDTDVPAQTLTFSLDTAPGGATIGGGNGVFTWTPSPAQTPGIYTVTVRVTDNGSPPMGATRSFTVTVVPPPLLTLSSPAGGQVSLSFPAIVGRDYRVEYAHSLAEPIQWSQLLRTNAAVDLLTIPDDLGTNTQRYYRVVQEN